MALAPLTLFTCQLDAKTGLVFAQFTNLLSVFMTKYSGPIFLGVVLALTGCGKSLNDEILASGKCYRAAKHLNDEELLRATEIHMQKLSPKLEQPGSHRNLMRGEISTKLSEEMQPQGTSTDMAYQYRVLKGWQTSDYCSKIRERALRVD